MHGRVYLLHVSVPALPPIRGGRNLSERMSFAAQRRRQEAARAASKRLSMRRLATLSHTRRGGVSGAQLLALQGHNHTSERVD